MQIAIVTQDEALSPLWVPRPDRPDDRFHLFHRPESLAESLAQIRPDHIVLSDRFFELDAFCDYAEFIEETCPEAVVTVLLSDRHDTRANEQWMKFCLLNGIRFVPPHRSREAIAAKLFETFYGEGGKPQTVGGKLAVFVGSTPNIGTTFVAFGAAAGLAKRTKQSVAYLCLNLKSSKIHRYLGIDRPEATLDQIRAELRAGSLQPERLRQVCAPVKGCANLRVLFGNQLREQAEFFTPDDIDHLLDAAKSAFDVCIAEVNAYWDNAATICALLRADSRILVTTRELTHFQEDAEKWLRTLSPVFGLAPESFDVVLTQQEKTVGSAGFRSKDVRKETGMNLIGRVNRYPGLTEIVNQGKLADLFLGAHPISRDLEPTVRLLAAVCGVEPALTKERVPWIKRLTRGIAAPSGKVGETMWEG